MTKVTILVIDDEQSFLDIISDGLKDFDYKVLQALNGKMGCMVAQKFLPDIIVCDWEMPVMNGIETIRFLKSQDETKDIPVIMATGGMTSSENLEKALGIGAIDYIRKPIDPIELIARINSSLQLANSYKAIKKQNTLLASLNVELIQQKEEIIIKNEEIILQKNEIEEQNQKLEKLSLVAKKTDNAVAIMNAKGDFEWVNYGFTKLYGYSLNELIKERGRNVIDISGNPRINEIFNTCITKKKTVFFESSIISRESKEITSQVTMTPVTDEKGNIVKIIAVGTDISKIRDLERFKESIIHMIVHDLKNPLNTVICFSDLFKEDKHFNIILSAGKQMLNMVDDILDVQKFKHAKIKLELEKQRVFDTIKKAISDVSVLKMASIAGGELKIKNKASLDDFALYDSNIIRRVLVNLLTNAIKYTPSGGEIVVKSKQLHINEKNFIEVSVCDHGHGIPEDAIDTIFNEFTQVNKKMSGVTGSTGIGLTFCKQAVEAHEGNISVKSELGKGSEFSITLLEADGNESKSIKEEQIKKLPERVSLSVSEVQYLMKFKNQFKYLKIYDTSECMKILKEIKQSIDSIGIEIWIAEMENALLSFDDKNYRRLIDLINYV